MPRLTVQHLREHRKRQNAQRLALGEAWRAARGVAGTVINGVCRDVSASLARGYPLFSRGRFMRTGKDRVRLVSVGGQLAISSIDIHPSTIVCADADGVVAVPEASAGRIAEAAEQIERVESQIVAAVRAGNTLRQAGQCSAWSTGTSMGWPPPPPTTPPHTPPTRRRLITQDYMAPSADPGHEG